MKKKRVKLGVIGLGSRGFGILKGVLMLLCEQGSIEILGVCDLYEDRAKNAFECVKEKTGKAPICTTDYREVLAIKELDAVLVMTAWESHIEISTAAMKAGKQVGVEVGSAYSIDDCFRLVRTHEETGKHCMMLENCCYGRRELMVLNMVKLGVFGEIVHCSGGYLHDLRSEIANGDINRHYRQRNYLLRNCENYPTHELGPIAQVLNINRGNRMLYLTSVASCARGLHEYIVENRGADHPLAKVDVAQGDIVTTIIKCAGGQTIVLTLDTTLPRAYSRGFTVRGTKGMYCEDGNYIHMEGESEWTPVAGKVNSADKYAEEYEHPMWREYKKNPVSGHDGIDWLVYNAFIESVAEKTTPPIDTYDTASWMCISTLTEESIACGGKPVSIPDFTNGKWILRTEQEETSDSMYCLSKIVKK
ncbi:MAG: glycosyl hydrolase [Firmicutes bacterium HGW-Firmicutes-21]|nr:MAG: glycosyl hydrolase [Firmicutes bacterium HGW-Firmicutes-21]